MRSPARPPRSPARNPRPNSCITHGRPDSAGGPGHIVLANPAAAATVSILSHVTLACSPPSIPTPSCKSADVRGSSTPRFAGCSRARQGERPPWPSCRRPPRPRPQAPRPAPRPGRAPRARPRATPARGRPGRPRPRPMLRRRRPAQPAAPPRAAPARTGVGLPAARMQSSAGATPAASPPLKADGVPSVAHRASEAGAPRRAGEGGRVGGGALRSVAYACRPRVTLDRA